MGFTNNGLFIINENVDIRGEMSYYEKLEHISDYEENDIFSVIEPTIAVMKHFYDEISYVLPTITCWGLKIIDWFLGTKCLTYISIIHMMML